MPRGLSRHEPQSGHVSDARTFLPEVPETNQRSSLPVLEIVFTNEYGVSESGQRKMWPQSIQVTTGARPRLAPYIKIRPLASRMFWTRARSSFEKSENGFSGVDLSCCSIRVSGAVNRILLVVSL